MRKKQTEDLHITNMEKGELLYQFFPLNIKYFVQYVEVLADQLLKEPKTLRDFIPNTVIVNDHFLNDLNKYTTPFLQRHRNEIISNADMFCSFYFKEKELPFTTYCLKKYVSTHICPPKFKKLVHLLFDL